MAKLLVKKSSVPKAGLGLFTLEYIPKGSQITIYPGRRISNQEYMNYLKDDPNNLDLYYVLEIDGLIIMADHSSRVSNKLAHMANDISMIDISKYNFKDAIEYINSTELVNCSFSLDRETNIFYLIAEKDISPNSELFVHYGVQYWLDIDSHKYSINVDEKNFLIKLDTDPEFYSMVLTK